MEVIVKDMNNESSNFALRRYNLTAYTQVCSLGVGTSFELLRVQCSVLYPSCSGTCAPHASLPQKFFGRLPKNICQVRVEFRVGVRVKVRVSIKVNLKLTLTSTLTLTLNLTLTLTHFSVDKKFCQAFFGRVC